MRTFVMPYRVDVQAGLSLCWSCRSYCWFCRAQVHMFSLRGKKNIYLDIPLTWSLPNSKDGRAHSISQG